ncbi:MAG: alanine dehydrogenase [Flavobacteriales bacterium]|nr:alanine dehydrogenase [Flavobacteriales bacterium]
MTAPSLKLGIIREGKVPPDRRVALPPAQCQALLLAHPGLHIAVQPSPHRAYPDTEYAAAGIPLQEDLSDRDLLIGVKEVPVEQLIPSKTYLFFSHTIKKQPHNRMMLQAVLERGITLLDHELLTNEQGERVLAFGHWAGVVGAYNAFRAWHVHHGLPDLKAAHVCHDQTEMEAHLAEARLPARLRIVMTGGGRVGGGAMEVLERRGFKRMAPADFLTHEGDGLVYTVLASADLYARQDGRPFDKAAFHRDPSGHEARFLPFARHADLYLACHFWDPRGPKILSAADLRDPDLSLRVVADISCDVGGPIDSTLHASSIEAPFYGYDPGTAAEVPAGTAGSLTVMAVDNLPCELPRDASADFGHALATQVVPELLHGSTSAMVARATIVQAGQLTERYAYLADYVAVKA